MKERFSILRQLLSEPPSKHGWRDIWDWLQRWERVGEEAVLAREYANQHLESWDDELRVIETGDPWKFVKDRKNLAWLPLARSLEVRGFPHSSLFESLANDPQWRGIRRLTLAPTMEVSKKLEPLSDWDNLRLDSLTLESRHWSMEMVEDLLRTESCRELKELRCLFPFTSRIPFVRAMRNRAFEKKPPLKSLGLEFEFFDRYMFETLQAAISDASLEKLWVTFSGMEREAWVHFASSRLALNLRSLTLDRRFVEEEIHSFPEDVSFEEFQELRELKLDGLEEWFGLRALQTIRRESLESLHLLGWRNTNAVYEALLEESFPNVKTLTLDGTASFVMMLRLLESNCFPAVEELTLHLQESHWLHLEKVVASIRWPVLKSLNIRCRGTWDTNEDECRDVLEHWDAAEAQARSYSSPTRLRRLEMELATWFAESLREPSFVLKTLLENGPCSEVRELALRRVGLNNESVKTLFSLELCKQLTTLDIGYNCLDDEGIARLAGFGGFENLRSLKIEGNQYTSVGEGALLESDLLRQLWFLRD